MRFLCTMPRRTETIDVETYDGSMLESISAVTFHRTSLLTVLGCNSSEGEATDVQVERR